MQRCHGNLAEDEASRREEEGAAMNFDDEETAAHPIRRRNGKTMEGTVAVGAVGVAAGPNQRPEFIEMCSRKRKKLRRSYPTNIKSTTRNSLPHGQSEELEETGKMELWTLEGELNSWLLWGTSFSYNFIHATYKFMIYRQSNVL